MKLLLRKSFILSFIFLLTHCSHVIAQSHIVGQWSGVTTWPVVGVHLALLPNGKVLVWDDTSDDGPGSYFAIPGPYHISVWDPNTGQHNTGPTAVRNPSNEDMFCGPHVQLPSGDILLATGDIGPTAEDHLTQIYDWETDMWVRTKNLNRGRYYPSVTLLQDGSVIIFGGFLIGGKNNNGQPEIYKEGKWTTLSGVQMDYGAHPQHFIDNRTYFPWTQVAPNGEVFYAGPEEQLRYINTTGSGSMTKVGLRDTHFRDYGSYATYDIGKILVAGGGNSPVETIKIDINGGAPVVSSAGNMAFGRRQQNLTILADGKVLVTGGNSAGADYAANDAFNKGNQFSLAGAVYNAEIWNPATSTWTTGAAMAKTRQYHSAALLLPDGRVVVAGGACDPCHAAGQNNVNAEIYSPPYLFNTNGTLATRPIITCAPAKMGYATKAAVGVDASISKVHLIKLGSVTHATNFDQRLVPLSFTQTGNSLNVTTPDNPNLAPPGYYMLIAVDNAGVPSEAKIIQLSSGKVDLQGIKSFESKNYPGYYISHTGINTTAKIATLTTGNATLGGFRVVPGLSDPTGVSFESVTNPGYYLRHQDDFIKLHAFSNTALYKDDATFYIRTGWADASMVSFEAKNYPGRFVRHYGYFLKISAIGSGSAAVDKNDATFRVLNPLPIHKTSIRSHNYPEYFIAAEPSIAPKISRFTIASSAGEKQKAAFRIVQGLADASAISFESIANPGYYLKHSSATMTLEPYSNTTSFKNEATFYAREGFAEKNRFSLESKDMPGNFIRHTEFNLSLSAVSSFSDQATKDQATWLFEMPVNESNAGLTPLTTNLVLSGPETVCSADVFTIHNVPAGTSITWSISPAGIALITPNGNSVTVTKILNGTVTLTAVADLPCGPVTLTKTITIGTGNPPVIEYVNYDAECGTYMEAYATAVSGATQYTWSLNSGGGQTTTGNYYSQYPLVQNPQWGNVYDFYLTVQVETACGISDPSAPYSFSVGPITGACPSEFFALQIAPNPTDRGNTSITLKDKKTSEEKKIKKLLLLDKNGTVLRQWNFGEGSKKPQLTITGMMPGTYILSATQDDKEWISQKLIIR